MGLPRTSVSRRKSHLNVARDCSSSSCCYCIPCPVKSWQTGLHLGVRCYCFNYKTTACKTFNEDTIKIFFFCNLTSWFHFWNKCLEKPHVRLCCYELSDCWGTALQHSSKVSCWHQLESAAAQQWLCKATAGRKDDAQARRRSGQEGQGRSRRSGQDQAQGQANPSLEGTSHSPFPCSLVPGYSTGPEHGHQTLGAGLWRVCWYLNVPDTVKTKM